MASKREYSLRQYLMAFGAALLVPILGLAAISMWEFARAEKQQNEQRAQAAAEQIIADIDQELARLQAAGQALASRINSPCRDQAWSSGFGCRRVLDAGMPWPAPVLGRRSARCGLRVDRDG